MFLTRKNHRLAAAFALAVPVSSMTPCEPARAQGDDLLMPICSPAKATADSDVDREFAAENDAAMARMMAAMAIRPSGDIDRDFVAMMRPHHHGAIDMAQSYLRYGRNEQLRRIAQEIVVEQGQEIAAMEIALGNPPPPSAPAETSPAPHRATIQQTTTK